MAGYVENNGLEADILLLANTLPSLAIVRFLAYPRLSIYPARFLVSGSLKTTGIVISTKMILPAFFTIIYIPFLIQEYSMTLRYFWPVRDFDKNGHK